MQLKLKICDGCQKPKKIWKRVGRELFCQQCWVKHPNATTTPAKPTVKQKKISRHSPRTAKQGKEYTILRKEFMLSHTQCEAHLHVCTGEATDVHHTFWGADRSKYFLEVSTWKAVCRSCHREIHDRMSAEEAIQLNLKNFKDEKI